MNSRQLWYRDRIEGLITCIQEVNKIEDWIEFKNKAHELACELLYATTEWDKYYRNLNGNPEEDKK